MHTILPPFRVSALGGPWPLHGSAATRAIEVAAGASAPGLMERAGLAVARLTRALAPHARRALVLAGPGNNGGDGWVAARWLHEAALPVQVLLVGNAARLPADASLAMRRAVTAGVPWRPFDAAFRWEHGAEDIALDALLGLGGRRAPEGTLAAAIARFNALACHRLAVDLPSGLNPDTGALLGEVAARADATLCLLSIKPGLFTGHGRDHAGGVWWHDLGIRGVPPTARLAGPPVATQRPHAAHKGSFGDVVVVGGAPGMAGAAWLAAGAALAAGAGRVYVSPLLVGSQDAASGHLGRPELMVQSAWWQQSPAVLTRSTVVCGCGGGQAVRTALPALLAHAGRLVLDADALNAVASDSALRKQLAARGRRRAATVLTPHPLEAARLLRMESAAVQADRLAAAQALAVEFRACVVLKGSGTWVVAPGVLPSLNPTGNAALSTAGTGDVLAGWVAGLWSDRSSGGESDDAWGAACDAVWLHGRAADVHRGAGLSCPLRAQDLVEAIAALSTPPVSA